MIYINDYWEAVSTLDKCLNLVREYNKELAAKIVELLPVHTDEEYYELFKECEMAKNDCNDNFDELCEKENTIRMLEEELRRLKNGNS